MYPGHELKGGSLLMSPHQKWLMSSAPDGVVRLRLVTTLVCVLTVVSSVFSAVYVKCVRACVCACACACVCVCVHASQLWL